MMNFFVLNAEQRASAIAHNGDELAIDPRAIDGVAPGTGINLNDNAADCAPGAVVELTGAWVAPTRIADDPDYLACAPDMVAYLLTLPFCSLETATIFAPPPPEDEE